MVGARSSKPFSHLGSVALVGMMGSGKTTVGLHLADQIGLPFVDIDREIEKAANMTVSEIFDRDGESFFRDRETQVLERLMHGVPCVLSTGGGTFMRPKNRALISANGISVWLRAELEVLWARVKDKTTRPLLMQQDPYGALCQIEASRRATYAMAELVVDTNQTSTAAQVAAKIVALLNETKEDRPHA